MKRTHNPPSAGSFYVSPRPLFISEFSTLLTLPLD
jgi:hypothetical protein